MTSSGKATANAIVGYLDAFGRTFCKACISATVSCLPIYSWSRPRAFENCRTCGEILQLSRPPAKGWHGFVVLNEMGEVLGVYGASIRAMADALAEQLRRQFPESKIEVAPVELPFRPAVGALVHR